MLLFALFLCNSHKTREKPPGGQCFALFLVVTYSPDVIITTDMSRSSFVLATTFRLHTHLGLSFMFCALTHDRCVNVVAERTLHGDMSVVIMTSDCL